MEHRKLCLYLQSQTFIHSNIHVLSFFHLSICYMIWSSPYLPESHFHSVVTLTSESQTIIRSNVHCPCPFSDLCSCYPITLNLPLPIFASKKFRTFMSFLPSGQDGEERLESFFAILLSLQTFIWCILKHTEDKQTNSNIPTCMTRTWKENYICKIIELFAHT